MVLGPAAAYRGVVPPLAGFGLYALGGALGGPLAIGLGIRALRKADDPVARPRSLLSLAVGGLLLAGVGASAAGGAGAPVIHDVSTDLQDPPAFSDAVRNAPGRRNGVDYPDGGPGVPADQREALPRPGPHRAGDRAPGRPWPAAGRWRSPWAGRVTSVDEARGTLEAHETTALFRFVDDVVVRVRPREGGSVVDVRSNSRVGGGDLGANAARIRAFRDALVSSVP